MSLLKQLREEKRFLLNVETCPPRMDLPLEQSIEAWIDSNHLMRKIAALKRFLFMTDGAIGRREEPNLRHITVNLSPDTERARIIPILTTKHTLDYCLGFAERACALGFTSLVVLGGDKTDGAPRCVSHAWELRRLIRQQTPGLTLGGWASPHGGRRQVDYILDPEYSADFFMAQIVSHYQMRDIDEFLNETARAGVRIPGIFGVFYYRSANVKTLQLLGQFFPVPVDGLKRDFGAGTAAEAICASSVHALIRSGAKNIYISNLPAAAAARKLAEIETRVDEMLVVS
jgi:5,10-methylenetetrahydrofolate reductase